MTHPDFLLEELARYALAGRATPARTLEAARLALADALGCAALASTHEECRRLLGPLAPGTVVPDGARVPTTSYELDPVEATFQTGALIRWLDYNDTWLAAEWGHPSDNFAAILSLGDHLARRGAPLTVADVLEAAIVAYEIQGVLALENSFNRVGLDHVILVKVASAAAAGRLLSLDADRLVAALSNAWIDGHPLRIYRHAPNIGSRKSWAAGDAAARAVRLALLAERGEMGYPSALGQPEWGFEHVLFRGQQVRLGRPLGTFVMDNILFKLVPAEFHAQTAAECAFALHEQVRARAGEIERIEIQTQEPALRIIDKSGPLRNPADRDHSLQYVTVVSLLYGELTDLHYGDDFAADPEIDPLRQRCVVEEDERYSRDYLDPAKRSIANAVRVCFADGSSTDRVEAEYPIGHPRRRAEALPRLREKLRHNLAAAYGERSEGLVELLLDDPSLPRMPVDALLDAFVVPMS